jgi:hypothetical protein
MDRIFKRKTLWNIYSYGWFLLFCLTISGASQSRQ